MSYTVTAMYTGINAHLDKQIEKAARREADGSGYGFGERDLTFTFATKRGADSAVKRIKKLGFVRSFSQEN